jgi:hypothetical protein
VCHSSSDESCGERQKEEEGVGDAALDTGAPAAVVSSF